MPYKINPPQFMPGDPEEVMLDKQRQFVEEVIRAVDQLSEETTVNVAGGSGYPPQLGYAGVR